MSYDDWKLAAPDEGPDLSQFELDASQLEKWFPCLDLSDMRHECSDVVAEWNVRIETRGECLLDELVSELRRVANLIERGNNTKGR